MARFPPLLLRRDAYRCVRATLIIRLVYRLAGYKGVKSALELLWLCAGSMRSSLTVFMDSLDPDELILFVFLRGRGIQWQFSLSSPTVVSDKRDIFFILTPFTSFILLVINPI